MTTNLMPGASATMASALNNMTTATVTNVVNNLIAKDEDIEPTPIFLQTKAAQGLAGAFVALALFLTCQQVSYHLVIKFLIHFNIINFNLNYQNNFKF